MKKLIIFGLVLVLLSSFVSASSSWQYSYDFTDELQLSDWTLQNGTDTIYRYDSSNEALYFKINRQDSGNPLAYFEATNMETDQDYEMFASVEITGSGEWIAGFGCTVNGIGYDSAYNNKGSQIQFHSSTSETKLMRQSDSSFEISAITSYAIGTTHDIYMNSTSTTSYGEVGINNAEVTLAHSMLPNRCGALPFYGGEVSSYVEGFLYDITIQTIDYMPSVSLFELTTVNAYNSTSINNFTANLTNTTTTTSITTTNGSIFYPSDQLADIYIYDVVDYFDRNYSNYDTSVNLEADLIPSIFPVYVQENKTNETVYNFTVSIYNDDGVLDTVTAKGDAAYINYEMDTFYNINITAEGYAFYYSNITDINATNNYTFWIFQNNSIDVNIYDSITNDYITQAINVEVTGDSGYFNLFETSNGSLFLSYLDEDQYTFSFYGDSYDRQDYIVSVSDNEYKVLNAFLLNSSLTSTVTINIVDPYSVAVEGAVVTLQQQISGSWVTISQKTTDTTGSTLFYLRIGTNYRVVITKTGYVTQTSTITPTSNPYSATIKLSPVSVYNYTQPLECIDSFAISPSDYILPLGNTSFNLSISSDGYLSYFGVRYNSTEYVNITGSPSGGVSVLWLNLTSGYTNFDMEFFFKCSGYDKYTRTVSYRTDSITTTNTSITSSLETTKESSTLIQRMIIMIISVFIILLICFEMGLPIISYPFAVSLVIIAYTLSTWIPALLGTFITLLLIIPSIYSWRGGFSG